jgi:hypothetical protein
MDNVDSRIVVKEKHTGGFDKESVVKTYKSTICTLIGQCHKNCVRVRLNRYIFKIVFYATLIKNIFFFSA